MATVSAVQEKIKIEDIKDGVVVLKDKSIRAVLMCSSINFALKSNEEQTALIYAFQGFLNSLDFPIQILIISRKFDISQYVAQLEEKQKIQQNELLRILTSEYIDFIKGLTELTNVITESFYLAVPFAQIEAKNISLVQKLSSVVGIGTKTVTEEQKTFEELKAQLWQRVNFVITGLESFGIKSVPLNTEELVELYYRLYNPEAKEKPPLIAELKQEKPLTSKPNL